MIGMAARLPPPYTFDGGLARGKKTLHVVSIGLAPCKTSLCPDTRPGARVFEHRRRKILARRRDRSESPPALHGARRAGPAPGLDLVMICALHRARYRLAGFIGAARRGRRWAYPDSEGIGRDVSRVT